MRCLILFSIFFIFTFFILTTESRAEEELAPGFGACIERSNGGDIAMTQCAHEAYEYWDRKLNIYYKKAKASCESDSCRKKLLSAQRAWVQYKEKMQDVILMDFTGGTLSRLNSAMFAVQVTKYQAEQLESFEPF